MRRWTWWWRVVVSVRRAVPVPLWLLATLVAPFALEVLWHRSTYAVAVPEHDLDPPFQRGCREPPTDPELVAAGKENAVFVMLARNADIISANHTVTSIERRFNKWFHYPILFLNDEPWDPEFVRVLNATASGGATFEQIPRELWTYPDWIDQDAARESIRRQGNRGIHYAGKESYHHMCRFYSGNFYKLEALKPYKWYWRLEPDVDFLCDITYDPFAEMARRGKSYGFTISLYEESDTCPSLFRLTSDWKTAHRIPTTELWKAMVSASWIPFPLRRLMSWLPQHDALGDGWSLCHYWSNFEIADLDFFRGRRYQEYFDYLDRHGGFYFERWGDASVHALAVAMLLPPTSVHHFEDIGYRHDFLYQCPANAPGAQLPESDVLGRASSYPDSNVPWFPPLDGGSGCRCECDGRRTRNHAGYCLDKLKQPTRRERHWFTWLL